MRKTAFFICPFLIPAAAQQPAFEEVLAKVAVYAIGDNEKPLAEMHRLVAQGSAAPAAVKQMEQSFIKALEGQSSLAGKEQICRHLMLIGSVASVPALTKMLDSTETADMARYALERIPGAAVDQALRDVFPKATGKVKVGILNTLGRRRDVGSVATLRGLLQDSDPTVTAAAAAAMGLIADPAAAAALASARLKTSGALRIEVDEAYLQCAEQMVQKGDKKGAFAAFKELSAAPEPQTIRIAALRGLAVSGGNDAVPLLTAAMKASEPKIQGQAIRQLSTIPGAGVTTAMGQALAGLGELAKIQVLTALADRGDRAALPYFVGAAKGAAQPVRAAALLELGKIGDASAIPLLAETAARNVNTIEARDLAELRTGGLPNERQMGPPGGLTEVDAARESLYRLRGADIDKAILAAISSADPRVKVELIAATSERGIKAATGTLLKFTTDSDREVRRASLRALRNTAAPPDVPVLLALLGGTRSAERPEVVRVLSSALRRSDTASVDPVLSAYQSASDADLRGSLLSVLAQVGRDESLPVLRSALKDSNPEIRRGGIRALSDWPNTTPMADLVEIAKSDPNAAFQVLALQGYIRLIGLPDGRLPAETVKMLSEAMSLAKRPDEKKTVLSMLQGINTAEALAIAEAAAKDHEVAEEAKMAAERIRQRLAPRRRP